MVYIDLQVNDLVRVGTTHAVYVGMTGRIVKLSGQVSSEGFPETTCNIFIKLEPVKQWSYPMKPLSGHSYTEIQVLAYQLNLVQRPPKKLTRLETLIL